MRNNPWLEVIRPFSLTASAIPVLVGTAFAWQQGHFNLSLFLLTLAGCVSLQMGTNMINEYYDVKNGVDTEATRGTSNVILTGRLAPVTVKRAGVAALLIGFVIGVFLAVVVTPKILILAFLGVIGGYFYTAGPFAFKYLALGTPFVFFLMGPLIVTGAFMVQAGYFSWDSFWVSLPVGFLVSAILHGNDMRDIYDDSSKRIKSTASLVGLRGSAFLYYFLVGGAYLTVVVLSLSGVISYWGLLALVSLPAAMVPSRVVWKHWATPEAEPMALVEAQTAGLHLKFGLLLTLALIFQGAF